MSKSENPFIKLIQSLTENEQSPDIVQNASWNDPGNGALPYAKNVANKENDTKGLEDKLAAKNKDIKSLEDKLADKNKDIKSLEDKLADKNKDIKSLKDKLADKNKDIKSLEDKLADKKNDIKSLEDKLAEKNKNTKALKDKLAEKKSELKDINEELANKKNDIKNLKGELADKNKGIKNLKDELADKKNDIKTLKDKLADKNNDENPTKNELIDKKNDIKTLKDKLANKNNDDNPLKDELIDKKNGTKPLKAELIAKKHDTKPLKDKLIDKKDDTKPQQDDPIIKRKDPHLIDKQQVFGKNQSKTDDTNFQQDDGGMRNITLTGNADADIDTAVTISAGIATINYAILTAITSPPETNPATTEILLAPATLQLSKSVDATQAEHEQTIEFLITIENTGQQLADSFVIQDLLPNGLILANATPSEGTYDPATGLWSGVVLGGGEQATLMITATVDLNDPAIVTGINANTGDTQIADFLTNTAIFSSNPNNINTTNSQVSVNIDTLDPDLALAKSIDNPTPTQNTNVVFTLTLTHEGADAASNIVVTDLLPAGLQFVSADAALSGTFYNDATGEWFIANLNPGQQIQLNITAEVVSATAPIINFAEISASSPNDPDSTAGNLNPAIGPQEDDEAQATINIVFNPDISVTKTGVIDDGGDGVVNPGDIIEYSYSVTNPSNAPLTNVTLVDDAGTPNDPSDDVTLLSNESLLPNQTINTTLVVVLAQADIDAGSITNIVTASGVDPNNVSAQGGATETISIPQNIDVSFVKSFNGYTDSNSNGVVDADDKIDYQLTIQNNGNVTITPQALSDALLFNPNPVTDFSTLVLNGDLNNNQLLDVNEQWIINADYLIQNPDIAAGGVINNASFDFSGPLPGQDGSLSSGITIPFLFISVDKNFAGWFDTDGNGELNIGDELRYTIDISSPTDISNVIVTDSLINNLSGPSGDDGDGILQSTETWRYTGSLTFDGTTQYINSATASGVDPNGLPAIGADSVTIDLPSVSFSKQIRSYNDLNSNFIIDGSDFVTFQFIFLNNGQLSPITNSRIVDAFGLDNIDFQYNSPFGPGGGVNAVGIFDLGNPTADAINTTGVIVNNGAMLFAEGNIFVDGVDSGITLNLEKTASAIHPIPKFNITKSIVEFIDDGNNNVNDGDQVKYQVAVTTSTGDLTFVEVNDSLAGLLALTSGDSNTNGVLDQGETWIYDYTHTLQADDINLSDQEIINTATVNVTDSFGVPNTESASVTLDIPQIDAIKNQFFQTGGSFEDRDNSGSVTVDDIYTFQLQVINSGSNEIQNILLNDPLANIVDLQVNNLGPSQEAIVSATVRVTQSMLDNKGFTNTFSAVGFSPEGLPTTDSGSVFVLIPSIEVDKTLVGYTDTDASGTLTVDDQLIYDVRVTNTVPASLVNLTVTDSIGTLSTDTIGFLAPNSSEVITSTVTITDQMLLDKQVVNEASVSGSLLGVPFGDSDTVVVDLPSVTFAKEILTYTDLNNDFMIDDDDLIKFNFSGLNDGIINIDRLNLFDSFGIVSAGFSFFNLMPNDSYNLAPFNFPLGLITAIEINDTSEIFNDAVLTATANLFADGADSGITVNLERTASTMHPVPKVSIDKIGTGVNDTNGNDTIDAGEVISYRVEVTSSTGGLTFVEVEDSLAGTLTRTSGDDGNDILDDNETWVYEYDYTVKAGDIDPDYNITNTATVKATDEFGVPAKADDSITASIFAPTITVDKQLSHINEPLMIGSIIEYDIIVTSTTDLVSVNLTESNANIVSGPSGDDGDGILQSTETWTYTAEHVYAGDLIVINTVDAFGSDALSRQTPTVSDSVRLDLPFPEFSKTLISYSDINGNHLIDEFDQVEFIYIVNNTSLFPMDLIVVNDEFDGSLFTQQLGVIFAGNNKSTSETFTLTAAGADAINNNNQIFNKAEVTGLGQHNIDSVPNGNINFKVTADETYQLPQLSVEKELVAQIPTASGFPLRPFTDFVYEIRLSNSTSELSNVVVNDSLGGILTSKTGDDGDNILQTDETWIYQYRHDLTFAQFNDPSNQLVNTATVTATDFIGVPVKVDASETVALPKLNVELVNFALNDIDMDGNVSENDTLTYEIRVTTPTPNGTSIVVFNTDLLIGTLEIQPLTRVDNGDDDIILGADEIWVYEVQQTISAANVSIKLINNSITARGQFDLTDTVPVPVSESTDLILAIPSVSITKELDISSGLFADNDGSGSLTAGDDLLYTIRVENTAPFFGPTLQNLVVEDVAAGLNQAIANLSPGSTSTINDVKIRVTDEMLAAGKVENTASVSGTGTSGGLILPAYDEVTLTTNIPTPTITKEIVSITDNGDGVFSVGDIINYEIVARNPFGPSGQLFDLVISDPVLNVNVNIGDGLGIFISDATVLRSLTADANIAANGITNTAIVTAETEDGIPVSAEASVTYTPSIIGIDKDFISFDDVNTDGIVSVGDKATFQIDVFNLSNAELQNIVLNDTEAGIINQSLANLAPGGFTSVAAIVDVTNAHLLAGGIVNTADVTATDEFGLGTSDTTDITLDFPQLQLEKVYTGYVDVDGDGAVSEDDIVEFEITFTNSGQTTIHNVLLDDPLAGIDDLNLGSVNPGVPLTHKVEVVVDSDIVTNLEFTNEASATGVDEKGLPVSATSNSVNVQLPSMVVSKELFSYQDTNNNFLIDQDDTVTFTFPIDINGLTPISNLRIVDSYGAIPVDSTFPGPFNPGPFNINSLFVIDSDTANDINDTAQIFNDNAIISADGTVFVNGIDSGIPINLQQTVSTSHPTPTLDLTNIAVGFINKDDDPNITPGDVVEYQAFAELFQGSSVENVVVNDSLAGNLSVSSGDTNMDEVLDDTETWVYNYSYTVQSGDVIDGQLTNTTTITGKDSFGVPAIAIFSDLIGTPDITLTKSYTGVFTDTDQSGAVSAGDVLDFNVSITNNSFNTVTNIVLNDPAAGITNLSLPDINSGETIEQLVFVELSSADISNGSVTNTAQVTGNEPKFNFAFDEQASDTVVFPQVSIEKRYIGFDDNDSDGVFDSGDVMNFEIIVTNPGNDPLAGVEVSDTFLRANVNVATILSDLSDATFDITTSETTTVLNNPVKSGGNDDDVLENGETWTYSSTADFEDADLGITYNVATVSALSFQFLPVFDSDDELNLYSDNLEVTTTINETPISIKLLDPISPLTINTQDVRFGDDGDGLVGFGDSLEIDFQLTNNNAADVDPQISVINTLLRSQLPNIQIMVTNDGDGVGVISPNETWEAILTYTFEDNDPILDLIDDLGLPFDVADLLEGGLNLVEGDNDGNTLNGTDANDVLVGLGGDDDMTGGLGDDQYIGGSGADTMNINLTLDEGDDVSFDFARAEDKLAFNNVDPLNDGVAGLSIDDVDAVTTLSNDGTDVRIDFPGDGSLVLVDVGLVSPNPLSSVADLVDNPATQIIIS